MPGVSRRLVVGVVGAGVAVAPFVATPAAAQTSEPSSDPERVAALLHPLVPGSRLARWNVLEIHPLERGAVTIEVSGDDGHVFRLEVLARDPSPLGTRPPGRTAHYAIHVKNGGDGWLPTAEEQGLAAMTLATVIAKNEDKAPAEGFLTYSERIERHSDALLPAR